MWNKPSDAQLAKLPAFYSSEEVPLKDKVIGMHFFIGGCDFYPILFQQGKLMLFLIAGLLAANASFSRSTEQLPRETSISLENR